MNMVKLTYPAVICIFYVIINIILIDVQSTTHQAVIFSYVSHLLNKSPFIFLLLYLYAFKKNRDSGIFICICCIFINAVFGHAVSLAEEDFKNYVELAGFVNGHAESIAKNEFKYSMDLASAFTGDYMFMTESDIKHPIGVADFFNHIIVTILLLGITAFYVRKKQYHIVRIFFFIGGIVMMVYIIAIARYIVLKDIFKVG